MIDFKADFSGLERLIAAVPDAIRESADAMADSIYEESQKRVPRDTGDLKKSGRTIGAKHSIGRVRYGHRGVPYAAAVEFGDGRGNQFLRSSLMEKAETVHIQRAADVLRQHLTVQGLGAE